MAWVILLLAGLCEIIWAVGLKYTGGFTRLWPSVGILAVMTASAGLLSLALKSHSRRHGLCGVDRHRRRGRAALGIYLFDEPADLWRLSCIGLVLAGVVGLRLGS